MYNGINEEQNDLMQYLALLRSGFIKTDNDMTLGREVETDEEVAIKKKLREEHQQ